MAAMRTEVVTETFTQEDNVTDPYIASWQYHWRSSGRSDGALDNMTRELRRFATHLGRPLDTATRADCEGFIAERVSVSVYSANYLWRALRSFYGFLAEEDGLLNPVKNTKAPKIPEPATKVVTEDEYIAMLAAVKARMPRVGTSRLLRPTFETRRDQALLMVLWSTGLRRSELARLSVADVDAEARHLVIRKSKTGRSRVVPMSSDTTRMLLPYMRRRQEHRHSDSRALWLGHKGAMTSDGIRQVIERVAKEAGVKVSAHQFRRSLAERWLSNGGSQTSLMAVAGWTTPTMPGRYTRSVAGQVAEAEYRRIFN